MATHHLFSFHSLSLSFLLSSVLITFALAFGQHGHAVSDSILRRTDVGGDQDMGHGAAISHNKTREDAKSLVEQAWPTLRAANRNRLQNPRLNKLEFPPAVTPDASHSVSLHREGNRRRDTTSSTVVDDFVPDKLIRAAAIVAELTKHDTASTEQQQAAVASLKAHHWSARDDANNSTLLSRKRHAGEFWMESMNMNGRATSAGDNYEVFRNVRDYGAKGDGVTDDTAAINRAVSDGGRCGRLCGSSTEKPAVIYFPSGTYLVSSSIIQYYNTQFFGNPVNRPIILAAKSFVGLGVMSSNVYVEGGGGASWYIPQNNFQRSIRNFVIDITNTNPDAYVCGIHWQVAQATDLTRIDFYMKPGTTQQGIFMENGSGGSMSELYFQGGNLGAYFGNQQFTSRNLLFFKCKTAVQIHWDWAWSMHNIAIIGSKDLSQTGIVIVGGAGGPGGTGPGATGSFVLLDSKFTDLSVGIRTSLLQENSTSMLVQNCRFQRTRTIVKDVVTDADLIPGGEDKVVESWGFGKMVHKDVATSQFQNGKNIPAANRTSGLTVSPFGNIFSRSAPTYQDVPGSSFINIKSMGAKGDHASDDTATINRALKHAANAGSIVFFPYGAYVVSDTIDIPVGSRIVGQVWPMIIGVGAKFQDEQQPRPVVRVGKPGESGVVEISDMLFTAYAGSVGAVVVEWNVHESTQGSAAMWNSPIRVGGTVKSGLQARDCPKNTGRVNRHCIGAALLLHLTRSSSAYLENIWAWTADHDLDVTEQTQIDVYVGRGILIESRKPTWLWGTASEHNILYQYQLSNAKNIFLGMIQTETPYYQPSPRAPAPFTTGIFPNDPAFEDCSAADPRCAMAWALRIVNSTGIHVYSAGLYSFFSNYSQACLVSEDCQTSAVQIEQSSNVWIYSLATKAMKQMVSPVNSPATPAAANQNGFVSSLVAWLHAAPAS
ncbi:hypothetical protein EsDP_00001040 [Epichloe bromicola]|uniref:Rhamnogalacturonase A/B/Epimerase-like pectate lyase domain-containing protein n=1 Tax=Epichloe bromicola TaxID=79588 RepID=A0ABQ0CGM9_9HYPO